MKANPKTYHYTESGLNNVWLSNGFTYRKTAYGTGVVIKDMNALHRAIADALVKHKPRLTGAEFRFIRKELDMSQAALARLAGKDAQSIARWEKSSRPVPKIADRFMRAIYSGTMAGDEKIIELITRLNELDQQQRADRLLFEESGQDWKLRA